MGIQRGGGNEARMKQNTSFLGRLTLSLFLWFYFAKAERRIRGFGLARHCCRCKSGKVKSLPGFGELQLSIILPSTFFAGGDTSLLETCLVSPFCLIIHLLGKACWILWARLERIIHPSLLIMWVCFFQVQKQANKCCFSLQ